MSRNVEALKALCIRWNVEVRDRYEFPDFDDLAAWLAGQGVLAVDSLTDEQLEDLYAEVPEKDFEIKPGAFRAALRRCATGEPE